MAARGVSIKKKNYAWTPAAQMELAFINYNGSGKRSGMGTVLAPRRTLDGNHWFEEELPNRDTWWPVAPMWLFGLWHNGEELESFTFWQEVGAGVALLSPSRARATVEEPAPSPSTFLWRRDS